MVIRVGSNISALRAQRTLHQATDDLSQTMQRLSSGMRINSAADDAAGLAISTSLNADARIFSQAIRNANDGMSMLNIAQGTLSQLSNITDRLKELAFQSANGIYSGTQRRAIGVESDQLVNEFNRLVSSSSFNGLSLLDGSSRSLSLQLGSGSGSILQSGVGGSVGRNVGNGQVTSHSSISTGFGAGATSAAADVNNDGKVDLVYGAAGQANAFVVQIGNGDGTFGAAVSYSGFFSSRIKLSDVNNDGNLDIIGTGNGSGVVAVALGRGDGTFATENTFSAGLGAINLANFEVVDANGDGIEDIINFSSTANGYSIMLGNSDGTFRLGTSFTLSNIDGNSSFAMADMNNDGRMDIVYSTTDVMGSVVTLFGNGNGTFGSATTLLIGSGRATGITLGDLNRDGNIDITTQSTSGNATRVLLGNGNGTFASTMSYNTNVAYTSSTLADINSDGILDLFIANYTTGEIQTLIGNGDGSFQSVKSYSSGATNVFAGIAADIDNDGSTELLFGRNATSFLIMNQEESYSSRLEYLNLSSQSGALSSLSYLESATLRIQRELGSIGALMSRLNVATGNLAVAREQYMAAESRIKDVDVAEESARLVSKQILQQAAAAVLSQANLQPQIALKLLRE